MKLAKWIERNEVSQQDFADKIGCGSSMVSQILKGTKFPSPKLARRISRVTGLPLEVVLFEGRPE